MTLITIPPAVREWIKNAGVTINVGKTERYYVLPFFIREKDFSVTHKTQQLVRLDDVPEEVRQACKDIIV